MNEAEPQISNANTGAQPGPEHRYFSGNRRKSSTSTSPEVGQYGHVPTEVERKNASLRVELMAALQNTITRFKAVQEELQLALKNEEEALKSNQLYKRMVEGLLADVHTNEDKTKQIMEHTKQREEALEMMYSAILTKQNNQIGSLQKQLCGKEQECINVNKQLEALELQYRDIVVRSASEPSKVLSLSSGAGNGPTAAALASISTLVVPHAKSLTSTDLPTFSALVPAADSVGEMRPNTDIVKNLEEIRKLQALIKHDDKKRERAAQVGVMDELRAYLNTIDLDEAGKNADQIAQELLHNPATEPHYKKLVASADSMDASPTESISPESSFQT